MKHTCQKIARAARVIGSKRGWSIKDRGWWRGGPSQTGDQARGAGHSKRFQRLFQTIPMNSNRFFKKIYARGIRLDQGYGAIGGAAGRGRMGSGRDGARRSGARSRSGGTGAPGARMEDGGWPRTVVLSG